MRFKFPVIRKEIVDGKVKKEKGYIDFDVDVSLASQVRYETKFPDLAKREDLYNYSKRISEIQELSTAKILSWLKLLYCWIDIDIEFIDFLKLFDLTDTEYVKEFTKVLQDSFDKILDGSAEKN